MKGGSRSLSFEKIFGLRFLVSNLTDSSTTFAQLAGDLTAPLLIAHADVHVLTRALHDHWGYGTCLRLFDYLCPDGMPLVWLLRGKSACSERLYGPDMMLQMMDCGRTFQLRHFLLGGSPKAQQILLQKLPQRFPGLSISGHYSPPMGQWAAGEHATIAEAIRASKANCVWVALGCPKQEQWLAEHKADLPPALYFAVGAAFNFHAGLVAQAPPWVQQKGLEWLYRFIKEPRRLAKRYLVHNSLFIWYYITRRP